MSKPEPGTNACQPIFQVLPMKPTDIGVNWDVEFWAAQYPAYELARYNMMLGESPGEKLEALWR